MVREFHISHTALASKRLLPSLAADAALSIADGVIE